MLASRLLLIVAATVATVSIGVATLRPKSEPKTQQATPASLDEAIAAVEAKVKANPNDAAGWKTLGNGFFEAERFGEAATAYRRAAQLAPNSAENWSNLGEALAMATQGNVTADAKSAFTKAFALDAKDVRARYFLAVAQDIAGDHRGAIDAWFKLLAESPANAPWQREVRGLIERVAAEQKIDVGARLAALPKLPELPRGPTADQAAAIKGLPAAQQNEMIASMVAGLAKRLESNPNDVEGWTMLMRSYAALDRKDDGRAALQKATQANPASASQLNATATELGLR